MAGTQFDSIHRFINEINHEFITGHAREHSYRPALKTLLESIYPGIQAVNEPKRQAVGAPDFIIFLKKVPVAYLEAKDITEDLNNPRFNEQLTRYHKLSNLCFTNGLEWRFYLDGKLLEQITIAELKDGIIRPLPDAAPKLASHLENFLRRRSDSIKNAKDLARFMAQKAKILKEYVLETVKHDLAASHQSTIAQLFEGFKSTLIHDLNEQTFADLFAQTLTYGMFTARYYDTTPDNFSREEAVNSIPKSNPLLRKLFRFVSDHDLDQRFDWVIEDLVNIFLYSDVRQILANFGRATAQHDPILHFYETFLAEYDPKLRQSRGVYYTPEPVVNFIVRSVDEILKMDFGLSMGLADTSKLKQEVDLETTQTTIGTFSKTGTGKTTKYFQEVHKVQILDPATGTGTFLYETFKHIQSKFAGQAGLWPSYVHKDLIPRLFGFELMITSYTMAHLKLAMAMTESGVEMSGSERLNVYLTNSLEEAPKVVPDLFGAAEISEEGRVAGRIKTQNKIMVVMGNPPYSVSSTNSGEWIMRLIKDYKKELGEKKINLDDDYIKFIRYGQHFIDKNEEGILAYISNNSFIDGVTHRQMRKSLMQSFDTIYIIDLHGNAKKKEVDPSGGKDENVFDIQQGVSINIFVKTGKKQHGQNAEVFHYDAYGQRKNKYELLENNTVGSLPLTKLNPDPKYHFFVPKDFGLQVEYERGVKISELFKVFNSGVKTDRDELFIDNNRVSLADRFKNLLSGEFDSNFKNKYRIIDSGSYKITQRIKNKTFSNEFIRKIQYRPFDFRWIYYDNELVSRPAFASMKHFHNTNIGLITSRQFGGGKYFISFITKVLNEISSQPFAPYYNFPLYLYLDSDENDLVSGDLKRVPNLNQELVDQIVADLGLNWVPDHELRKRGDKTTISPLDLLDFMYAVLHSPSYREKYKEFLKIDFPRVQFPKVGSKEEGDYNFDIIQQVKEFFWKMAGFGCELRQYHLLEHQNLANLITQYPIAGGNIVEKPEYRDNKVYINPTQYFEGVPEIAWNFYIGGYQPAQKWLKDRKGRELSYEDILHYQRMIIALSETDRIMKEIG